MGHKHAEVKSRNESFAERPVTRIWYEQAAVDNPYIAETCRCHGYDVLDLMANCSFANVLYLLFQGELPNADQARLLELLMVGLINPGPRHPATRAAMDAGVGKTDPAHILPIALTIMGGEHLGAGEVEGAMRFLRKHMKQEPGQVLQQLLEQSTPPEESGDWHIVPGFGCRFGGVDHFASKVGEHLSKLSISGKALRWAGAFAAALESQCMGWLSTGVAAATFVDLGFHPRAGAGLFQLVSAPGLLAHGLELANKPITAMPFVDDEHYVIES